MSSSRDSDKDESGDREHPDSYYDEEGNLKKWKSDTNTDYSLGDREFREKYGKGKIAKSKEEEKTENKFISGLKKDVRGLKENVSEFRKKSAKEKFRKIKREAAKEGVIKQEDGKKKKGKKHGSFGTFATKAGGQFEFAFGKPGTKKASLKSTKKQRQGQIDFADRVMNPVPHGQKARKPKKKSDKQDGATGVVAGSGFASPPNLFAEMSKKSKKSKKSSDGKGSNTVFGSPPNLFKEMSSKSSKTKKSKEPSFGSAPNIFEEFGGKKRSRKRKKNKKKEKIKWF